MGGPAAHQYVRAAQQPAGGGEGGARREEGAPLRATWPARLTPRRSQKLLEDLEEAGNELLVADDTSVRYVTGECFVTLSNDTAEARLAAATAEAEQGAGKLRDELASIEKEMAALKVLLYGRFGSSINLEND